MEASELLVALDGFVLSDEDRMTALSEVMEAAQREYEVRTAQMAMTNADLERTYSL